MLTPRSSAAIQRDVHNARVSVTRRMIFQTIWTHLASNRSCRTFSQEGKLNNMKLHQETKEQSINENVEVSIESITDLELQQAEREHKPHRLLTRTRRLRDHQYLSQAYLRDREALSTSRDWY